MKQAARRMEMTFIGPRSLIQSSLWTPPRRFARVRAQIGNPSDSA